MLTLNKNYEMTGIKQLLNNGAYASFVGSYSKLREQESSAKLTNQRVSYMHLHVAR